jgi:hypothetical protein
MGFNRRKLEDQHRLAAEKEAAPMSSTVQGGGKSGCLNATVGLTARRFVDFLQTPPSKNCGDREEAKSHNACAKSDNKERKKECKKECHSSQ